MKTRILTDDFDMFYDISDIFESAKNGTSWTDRWCAGQNRTIMPGENFYITGSDSENVSVIASGTVIEADEDEQLNRLNSRYGDLSSAYCLDPYNPENAQSDEESEDELLWFAIRIESAVSCENDLKIGGITQSGNCSNLKIDSVTMCDAISETEADCLKTAWEKHVSKLLQKKQAIIIKQESEI